MKNKRTLKIIRTLEELASNPTRVENLSPNECQDILIKIAVLQPLLLAGMTSAGEKSDSNQQDTLLNVEEAAKHLRCSRDWLYRQSKNLPFVRRISPRQLRFSSKGIEKYIKNRPF